MSSRCNNCNEKQEQAEEIQEVLASGATSATVDGVTVNLDHDTLRAALRDAQACDPQQRNANPIVSTILVGRAF